MQGVVIWRKRLRGLLLEQFSAQHPVLELCVYPEHRCQLRLRRTLGSTMWLLKMAAGATVVGVVPGEEG